MEEEGFSMNGGDGAYSYTKNSQFQKNASESVKGMIHEAVIDYLDTQEILTTTVRIVDLGCSVGPNTLFAVENLIQAVEDKFCDSKSELEFQVLFNDHSSNDFNTLFASVPPERQYHVAGVPGSFYGRLFPRASITLAHSSYALQWLSQQPQGQGVPNEGRIHYSGAPEDVIRAYSDQFERDLGVFMSARAEEIVSGGLMFLIMPGTPDGLSYSELPTGVAFNFLGFNLMELANEGVVEKRAVDEFNLPMYFPTLGEMRKVIEKNGCFSIERMELTNPYSEFKRETNGASMIMQLRATTQGILTTSFGNSVVEKLFAKSLAKSEEIVDPMEAAFRHSTQLFLVLKRI